MSGKEVAAKLREALALMNDTGRHWFQGSSAYVDQEGETRYCSIGAIRKALYGDPYGDMDGDYSYEAPVTEALASVLNNVGDSPADTIVVWNDAGNRTWPDVVEAFTRAAEVAENEEVVA